MPGQPGSHRSVALARAWRNIDRPLWETDSEYGIPQEASLGCRFDGTSSSVKNSTPPDASLTLDRACQNVAIRLVQRTKSLTTKSSKRYQIHPSISASI